MKNKPVHAGHRQRMRQRFLDTGGTGFSSHELLELLLFGSVPRANTNPTAHQLINRFGSLENVLSASPEDLQTVEGVGASSARLIAVMSEACRRFREKSSEITSLGSAEELEDFILARAEALTEAVCMLVFINVNMSVTGVEALPLAGLLSAPDAPRRLSSCMLREGRERLIAVFVHPTSPPIPSAGDFMLTKMIAGISASIGMSLLDSMVCGRGELFSMRKSGAFSFSSKGEWS